MVKQLSNLTQQRLLELITYDPLTGVFTNNASSKIIKGGGEHSTYTKTRIDGKFYQLHRLAVLYMVGKFPLEYIDHIDHDPFNNKWSNLREVSAKVNCRNRQMNSNNTSGTTGVNWDKSRNKWKVIFSSEAGKSTNLGRFTLLEDAIACREEALAADTTYHESHGIQIKE